MKIVTFAPLKDIVKDIYIRCSSLNSALNPAMYEAKTLWAGMESTDLGDRIHNIIQVAKTQWWAKALKVAERHKAQILDNQPWFRENEMKWFADNAEQYIPFAYDEEITKEIAEMWADENCTGIETKRCIIIEYSGYRIALSWTSDLDYENEVREDGSVWWWMDDIKSSTGKWSQEKADEQRQKYYYTFLKCAAENLDWCRFRYMVVTRQKKAQKQIFEYYITKEEAEKVLKDDLRIYLTMLSQDEMQQKEEPKITKESNPLEENEYLLSIGYYDTD